LPEFHRLPHGFNHPMVLAVTWRSRWNGRMMFFREYFGKLINPE
jgi:hypothetical protein